MCLLWIFYGKVHSVICIERKFWEKAVGFPDGFDRSTADISVHRDHDDVNKDSARREYYIEQQREDAGLNIVVYETGAHSYTCVVRQWDVKCLPTVNQQRRPGEYKCYCKAYPDHSLGDPIAERRFEGLVYPLEPVHGDEQENEGRGVVHGESKKTGHFAQYWIRVQIYIEDEVDFRGDGEQTVDEVKHGQRNDNEAGGRPPPRGVHVGHQGIPRNPHTQ